MKKEKRITQLTERQKALCDLLLTDINHWWSQEEICAEIADYKYNADKFAHDRCATIGADRIVINAYTGNNIIIVLKDNHFKIATYEEYRQERASHIARLKSQARQVRAMEFKMKRDGEMDLFDELAGFRDVFLQEERELFDLMKGDN